ncbi:hypothetical protein KT99_18682 [Shewanella benthica KT99]|uniref:Uncharacterized protein n=1 Tax=Shewanella benthica KT99 TaxID=314608 RepID=A9CWU6_9GAMM|nr:hypothetical protein KT99_18682 [Shewanella benthica KT99]
MIVDGLQRIDNMSLVMFLIQVSQQLKWTLIADTVISMSLFAIPSGTLI